MTWVWVNTFSGMNIHLPAILGFTRYQGFDPSPHVVWISLGCSASVFSPFDIQCTHRGTMLRLARCLRDPCGDTWSDFVMGNSCTHEIHGPRININHLQVKCTACPHTKSDLVLGLPQYHGSPDFCGRKLLTSRRVAGNSIQRSKIRTKLIQGRFFFFNSKISKFQRHWNPQIDETSCWCLGYFQDFHEVLRSAWWCIWLVFPYFSIYFSPEKTFKA